MDWSKCTASVTNPDGTTYTSPTIDCAPLFIMNLIYWGILLSGTVALVFIILGGIRFLTSAGDPKKLDQGKKTIGFAVLGLFLILLSYFIVRFIGEITGVGCIDPTTPLAFGTCTP